jgi:hypothetical protein
MFGRNLAQQERNMTDRSVALASLGLAIGHITALRRLCKIQEERIHTLTWY